MGMIGYALGPKDIRRIAMGMARSAHNLSFKGSKHWFRNFLKRHPTLRKRICQKFDVLRAGAMNWQEIVKYFDLLAGTFELLKARPNGRALTASRIFNLDEIGFDRGLDNRWAIVPVKLKSARDV